MTSEQGATITGITMSVWSPLEVCLEKIPDIIILIIIGISALPNIHYNYKI